MNPTRSPHPANGTSTVAQGPWATWIAAFAGWLMLACCDLRGEGVIEATLSSGKQEVALRFARSGKTIRIENLRPGRPLPPFNLIDSETGGMTIVRPHNSTFLKVAAGDLAVPFVDAGHAGPDRKQASGQSPTPGAGSPAGEGITPPERPTPARIPSLWETGEASSSVESRTESAGPPRTGESTRPRPPFPAQRDPRTDPPANESNSERRPMPPARGPTTEPAIPAFQRPAMPAVPQLPPKVREMIARHGADSLPARLAVPGKTTTAGLSPTGASRMIHGLSCREFTLSDPQDGTLEVWATRGLMPFSLLLHEPPRPGHDRELDESWPEILREQGLFPMLAILRDAGGDAELARFEVTRIDRKETLAEPGAFDVPAGFHQITAPSF